MLRNKLCYFFLSIILLIYVAPANAASPVTYSCCVNFTTSNGTLVEGFENAADWTLAANTAAVVNTTDYREGSGSLQVTNTLAGAQARVTKTVNLNEADLNIVDQYIWIGNISNISSVDMYISTDAGLAKYRFKIYDASDLLNGWNHLRIDLLKFGNTGGENLAAANVVKIRYNINAVAGTFVNVKLDGFYKNPMGRAKFIFSFDDYYHNITLNALPIMISNGQVGFVGAVAGWNGADYSFSYGSGEYYTNTDTSTLLSNNWEVGSHSYTHSDMTTLTDSQLDHETVDSYNAINANFTFPTNATIIYPNGRYNYTVINNVSKTYDFGRATSTTDPYTPNDIDPIGLRRYALRAYNPGQSLTMTNYRTYINDTVNRTGLMILVIHDVSDDPVNDHVFTISNFTNISNYLASRTDIDVIRYKDMLIKHVPNNTPILTKTVTIESAGDTSIQVDNRNIDQTENMFVYPSDHSVNVTLNMCSGGVVSWTEQSDASTVSTHHVTDGCGFPSNSLVALTVNGNPTNFYMTNSTGWVSFDFNGTFGTPSFSLTSASVGVPQNTIETTNNMFGAVDVIAIISIILVIVIIGLAAIKLTENGGITELLPLVLVGIVVIVIVVFVVAYVLAPFLGAKM